jgi:hypothetical protein
VEHLSKDVRRAHELPSLKPPSGECSYINMGALDKNFFTTDAMVKAVP